MGFTYIPTTAPTITPALPALLRPKPPSFEAACERLVGPPAAYEFELLFGAVCVCAPVLKGDAEIRVGLATVLLRVRVKQSPMVGCAARDEHDTVGNDVSVER